MPLGYVIALDMRAQVASRAAINRRLCGSQAMVHTQLTLGIGG